jgi:diguanylate cyclase (GGDEF)-like protein
MRTVRILIVDDDVVLALRLRRVLVRLGHQVETKHDGESAWSWIEQCDPNVVISAWTMPRMDGLELCRLVRQRGGDHYVYFLLLTGREGRDDRFAALEAGADDFLTKPLDSAALRARLSVAARILGLHEELHEKARMLQQVSHELSRINERLAQQATTDPLTGLSNRRHFEEMLSALSNQAMRHDRAISLAMIDIDHFKSFNDQFGHPAGDDALRQVSNALSEGVRSHDFVARLGGEEFAIVLPETDGGTAYNVLERLRHEILSAAWPLRGVTISAGIATRQPTQPMPELVQAADKALYRAKSAGRNLVLHYDNLAGYDRSSQPDSFGSGCRQPAFSASDASSRP